MKFKYRVESFDYPGFALKFNPPLDLEVFEVENGELLAVRDKDLGLDVFSENSLDLLEGVREDIKDLWLNYAEESNEKLSLRAIELKNNLLKRIEKKDKMKEVELLYDEEIESLRDVVFFINGKEKK